MGINLTDGILQMADAEKPKPTMPPKNAEPAGYWHLPGGREGLQGSPAKVTEIIQGLPLPEHDRRALLEKLAAETAGFNFVTIRGHQVQTNSERGRETILTLHVRSSNINV